MTEAAGRRMDPGDPNQDHFCPAMPNTTFKTLKVQYNIHIENKVKLKS
jgi:hypothetical protein